MSKMKQIGKEQMKAVAVEVFERYKDVQKVSVASDGQAFIVDNGDAAAKNHAKNNAYGKELSVATFLRDELMQNQDVKQQKIGKKKAADLIAEIEKAETVEAVNAILGKDTRATVVEVAANRIEELEKAAKEGAETDTGANGKTEY